MSETRDVRVRTLLPWAAALLVVLALSLVGVRLFFNWRKVEEGSRLKSLSESPFQIESDVERSGNVPTLQPSPLAQLHALRAHEAELLDSYGWVDKSAGVVRIPIERAIELVARNGLPTEKGSRP